MSESIDFILTARDQASAIFRKTKEELQLLNHEVGKFRSIELPPAFDMGWITDAINQAQQLNEMFKRSSEVLAKGGASALLMKANIAALVGYASFQGAKMFSEWIFETKKWEKEFKSAIERSKELITELGDAQSKNLKQRLADIKEFGGTDEQKKEQAKAFREQLENDIRATKENKKRAQERMEMQKAEWGQFARGTAQRIEETKLEIQQQEALLKARQETYEALNEFIRDDPRDELRAAQEQKDLFNEQKESLKEQLEFAKLNKEQIELALIDKMKLNDIQKEELKTLIQQRYEYIAQQEEAERLRKIREKDLQDQLKARQAAVSDAEKALKDAQNMKLNLDRAPELQASDARLLTQQLTGPSKEDKQIAIAEKQQAIADAQRELQERQLEAQEALLELERARNAQEGFTL